jgi:serine protease
MVRLADGKLLVAGVSNGRGLFLRLKGETAPPTPAQSVIEFFNTMLGHYFITADASEASAIDQGSVGPGWQRTGKGFLAWTAASGVPDASLPVCRFYGTLGRGPNSHFYTVNANECAIVKNDPGWTYEGIAFYAFLPASEKCPGALQPVYRAYNNRFAQNDSNHRYAVDLSTLQSLVTQGWTIEGAVFCVPLF